jgi:DNA-binding transcriptional ArsR family regulator
MPPKGTEEEGARPDRVDPVTGVREISDARTLRALAHPVRIALLEALFLDGPSTATEVGERIGESPTTCSFHLRQLAKYGFVEEAGGGKGRARPWRVTSIGMRLNSEGDDPDTNLAAGALSQLWRDRCLGRYEAWRQTRADYPKVWRSAAFDSEFIFFLTPDELEELSEELVTMLMSRFGERVTDHAKRPSGSVPVEMLMFGYPLELPKGSPSGGGAA